MIEKVKKYIDKMYGNESFMELDDTEKDKIIFTAYELLKGYFKENMITDRIIALQILYMLDGEDEGFDKLRKQGVASYSVKGVSISFQKNNSNSSNGGSSLIAPAVLDILRPNSTGKIGSLI